MVFDCIKHKERTVLLQPDQDVSELCFLEAERVESLGVRNEAPGYVTTVREIVAPDAATDEQLEALLEAYGRQVSYFIHRFHSRAWRPYCSGSRYRYLRDRLVEAVAKKEEEGKKPEKKPEEKKKSEKKPEKKPEEKKKSEKKPEEGKKPEMKPEALFPIFGLQARQWKMALQQASSVVENDWALAQQRAKEKIERTRWYANLDGNERHYVNLLLSTMGDDFFLMMRGRTATFGWHRDREQLKKVKNPGSLCALVRRAIQKVKSKQIRRRACRSVWFDCQCYSVQIVTEGKETIQVVSLMSLTPGKRVKIKLRGKKSIKGTVKLVKTSRGWQLHTLSTPKTKEKSSEGKLTCAAMDMGFSEVFTMHDGAQFGRKLGEAISAQAETVDLKVRERNRLTVQAKNTKDPKKRRNILRYNLGSDTFDRKVAKHRSRVYNIVNRSLNEMLKQYPAEVYVVEDLSHRFYLKGFSKQTNRLLSSWVRGIIAQRLSFKTALHGVSLVKVPAAYSSQRCPYCGCVCRESRKGDRFECVHCGAKGHADRVACLNLLCRAHDPRFRSRMSKDRVLALELEEHGMECARRGTTPHKYEPRQRKKRSTPNEATKKA